MLLNIFFIIGIITTFSLFLVLLRWNRIQRIIEWYEKFEKFTNRTPKKSEFRKRNDYKLFVFINIVLLIELIFVFLTLITKYWFIPICLLVIGVAIKNIFRKNRWTITSKIIYYKYFILRLLAYIYLIYNI
jgi:hypothetical protein